MSNRTTGEGFAQQGAEADEPNLLYVSGIVRAEDKFWHMLHHVYLVVLRKNNTGIATITGNDWPRQSRLKGGAKRRMFNSSHHILGFAPLFGLDCLGLCQQDS